MLDFAFGPNGYGLTDGMRKEQDRISNNRMQFANNMATFLANNPYITPEAAQAFINSAAGTDNTLRGSVPNSLIGQINQENQRKRRIDTFQAFNEFTRLNPGATAAEFQAAISALGAQGIYGQDALKAIQSRSDQYRKDQETKRMFDQAQNVGQLRGQLMTDAKSIFVRNGFDVEKTKKELQSIYGDSLPVPLDTIVNPGMATMLRGDMIREYLPKAVDILGKNPNMTPEMLYGIWPELQGSPIVKGIYDAAQEERKKGISDKLYGNKKQVVDAVAQSLILGTDPQVALSESIRGLGIRPEDMVGLDTNSILSEAKALADKTKSEKDTALKQKQAQAAATVSTNIQAKIGNEIDAARFAGMSDSQLELEMRKVVEFDSGLTAEEIAQLPPEWYARLTGKIRADLNTRALETQQKRYDASRGIEATAADAIRKDSTESAKNATSEEALTFLGLKDAAAGGGIQAAVRDLATRYDMSGGRAGTAIQLAMEILANDPKAATDLTRALESDVRFQQAFPPITQLAAQQADTTRIRTGSDQPRPIPFTPWVQQEAAQIRKESDNYLSTVRGIIDNKASAEEKLQALSNFESRFNNNIAEVSSAYADRRSSQHIWTQANDQWNDDKFSEVRIEIQALQTRVQTEIQRAKAQLAREAENQRQTNMAPGKVAERPDDPSRSGFANDVRSLVPTDARMTMNSIQSELRGPSGYSIGAGPLGYFYKTDAERDTYGYINEIAQSPRALEILSRRPDLYALIQPGSPNQDPERFVQEFRKLYQSDGQ